VVTRGYRARNHHIAERRESTFNWGVQSFADTAGSTSRRSTGALAPLRPNQSGMHTCGFCSQRRQNGCWDRVGLYPADYGRDATTEAGQPAIAGTRPAGRGGMQGAESEFWNGWRATLILQDGTVKKLLNRAKWQGGGRGANSDREQAVVIGAATASGSAADIAALPDGAM
jgi:hypothetical protein